MVQTIKFSEFVDGGDLEPDNVTVGVEGGANTRFTNVMPLLAPGTTGDRPAADPVIYYRLRFNTTLQSYEYYSPVDTAWIQLEDSGDIADLIARLAAHTPGDGASMIGLENQSPVINKTVQDFANAPLIALTDTAVLSAGQFTSSLATGFVTVTTGTGVLGSHILSGTANQINITNTTGTGTPVWTVSSTFNFPGTFTVQNSTVIDEIIDDDTMASATDSNIPTAESVVAYIAATPGGAGGSNGEIQYNNAGTLDGDSGATTDGAGNIDIVGSLDVDNININGNTISSTNANGNISLSPNGTGLVDINSNVEIPAGIQFIFPSTYTAFQVNEASPGPGVGWITITNTMGNSPSISASGSPASLDVQLVPKGNGVVGIGNAASSTIGATLRLYEVSTTGNDYVALKAPDSVTTSYTMLLPDAPPAVNNQVLSFTTAGVASFVDQGTMRTASIAGTSQSAAVNTLYIAQNSAQTTITLPATFAVGDVIGIIGSTANTGGWVIATAAGDTIRVNNSTTSASGTVTSAAVAGQTIYLMCDVANTSWVMTNTVSTTLTTT